MYMKEMCRSYQGYKFIVVVIDEVTSFMLTIAIYQSRSDEIGDAVKEHVFSKYCIHECMIRDQDSTFMSALINYLFKKLFIAIKTVGLYNH